MPDKGGYMKENTALWKQVEDTDINYMKDVNFGSFKYKSIDAQYQILKATTLWGSYGRSWGVREERFTPIMTSDNSVATIIYTATLFYPEGEFCINSDIRINSKTKNGYVENKDFAKKVSTDALTKGLSKLGFSADIFMGKFDGNKYDGIESFEDPEEISEESRKLLNGYLKDYASDTAKVAWIKGKIAKNSEEIALETIAIIKKSKGGK
jgi:hypothetical protein